MSVNARPGSRMGDLQPDLIFSIADFVAIEPAKRPQDDFLKLSLINKHWESFMKRHPLSSSASFFVHCGTQFEKVWSWLRHSYHRNDIIQFLSLEFSFLMHYEHVRRVLDSEFADVTFKTLELGRIFPYSSSNSPELRLSFNAQRLVLNGFATFNTIDWSSASNYMRGEMMSMKLEVAPRSLEFLADTCCFKSLRSLDVRTCSNYAVKEIDRVLSRHPQITHFKICNNSFDSYTETSPLLTFDSLDSLQSLWIDETPVDLNTLKVQPVSDLTYTNPQLPISGWSSLSDTLQSLTFSSSNSHGTEIFKADHDILNPAQLYKFRNVKRFTYQNINSARFAQCLESGLYDDAMPLIEELCLVDDMISKKAVQRFISKHKRLRVATAHSDIFEVCDMELVSLTSSSNNFHGVEIFEADHDILDPVQFYQLRNLRRFTYHNIKSVKFAQCFESGLYDDAMPLIEVLFLVDDMISKKAVQRFISKHKRLRVVTASNDTFEVCDMGKHWMIFDKIAFRRSFMMKGGYD